ncbi:MAG: 50S ribosomal protein L18 [Candidatus Saccharibacteria bacterium]
MNNKKELRVLRHNRIRAKVSGTKSRPRMSIFRSLGNIYVQLIDDQEGKTLIAASSKNVKTKGSKQNVSAEVGKLVAQKAMEAGITEVVFDRGGYRYHGRVKTLADAAREAGLKF